MKRARARRCVLAAPRGAAGAREHGIDGRLTGDLVAPARRTDGRARR